jgi:hypothetical protein
LPASKKVKQEFRSIQMFKVMDDQCKQLRNS